MAGTGIDATTGKALSGWAHVLQSVSRIFATRIGSRVMRRPFGCGALALLGRRFTPQVVSLYRLLIVLALERWEPRLKVRSIAITGTVDQVRSGTVGCVATVDYMPRGHLGDKTVASQRDIVLS